MLTEKGDINWVETLASIAEDKGQKDLGEYIRKFDGVALYSASHGEGFAERMEQPFTVVSTESVEPIPVDYSKLSDHFSKPSTLNITRMPEATCGGCQ